MTNAAVLLFAKNIMQFYSNCRVRFLRIDGRELQVGDKLNIIKDKSIDLLILRIIDEAYRIFRATYQWEKPIRSLGVRGAELTLDHAYEQLDIFCDYTHREKQEKADAAVDEIRKRFGYFSIQRGLMYQDKLLSSLDAKGSHTVHPQGYFS